MTTAELHKILDEENKTISLKEYQEILYKLKNDTISCATREEFELQKQTPKYHWYHGETNAFEIALDLSEHINSNQKAIECLKEVREKLYKSAIQVVGTGVNAVRLYSINEIFDNKIKELEGDNDTTR